MHADPPLPIFPRVFALLGGVVFIASLVYFGWQYAAGFDDLPAQASARSAAIWNVALFSMFALHHSIFARLGVKAWIRRVAPPALERSIYVWISSVLFIGVCLWWRAVSGVAWAVSGTAATLMSAGQVAGGVLAVASARALDVMTLAGVRQTFEMSGRSTSMGLVDRGPYRLVRHPIYLGWFAAVWLAPHMTGARLVFAAVSCLYLVMAVPFEERDLRRTLGEAYEVYMLNVRWKIVPYLF